MEPHPYDALFFRYQREGSARSAKHMLRVVLDLLEIRSVLDVGCGAGAWLAEYEKLGVPDRLGVDGDYVARSTLLIGEDSLVAKDVTQPFDLGREFDMVQCLEVGEHVPASAAGILVDNLVRHGKMVLFSAAVPGQGGKDHINERPYDYWRDFFADRNYRLFDFVRPRVSGNGAIEPWYRYNVLFFAHDSVVPSLPQAIARARIDDSAGILDYSPLGYRLRKIVMRVLPVPAVSRLAAWKHRRVVRSLGKAS